MANVIQVLRANYQNYNNTEHKLIDYILSNPSHASESTIQDMAAASNVSTATISRFVKKIGFSSFRDFSLSLAAVQANKNESQEFFGEINEGDDFQTIANKVFSGAQNALSATLSQLKIEDLQTAVDWLIHARKVAFFGIGGSSIVAFNAYHKFLRTSLDVIGHPDYDIQLMEAVKMNSADVAFVISHSGRNSDTYLIEKRLKENKVKVIAITSFLSSPIAKNADLVLQSLAEEVNFRSESMSSLIAQLTIIDTLFTLVGTQLSTNTQYVVDSMRDVIEQTRENI